MTAKAATTRSDARPVVAALTATGAVDTVYRDVYLERARGLLAAVLPFAEFERLERQAGELAKVTPAIAKAVEKGNWAAVKELSARTLALRQETDAKRALMDAGRSVYAVHDVKLDPFSPGLQPFIGIAAKNLPALKTETVARLAGLERDDPSWREFYAGRRAAFQALVVATAAGDGAEAPVDAREAAARALQAGDLAGLSKLATTLAAAGERRTAASASAAAGATTADAGPAARDLLFAFSEETLARARGLGLAPRRLEARTEFATLRRYAWNPVFADESGRVAVKQVPLPAGTPDAFRERLEMLMIHPFVNSGGARHLPSLVAEDVLVEDFADPAEGEQPPKTELLAALGLPARFGIPRLAIEQALLNRGLALVDQALGLDPRAFRLVCIPPDVHLRLGEAEGWGRRPFWTHFDGYLVMADGRLRAAAGGDVRFGGLYDLLGISRDYDSDRVMARFAVVRRERMVAW